VAVFHLLHRAIPLLAPNLLPVATPRISQFVVPRPRREIARAVEKQSRANQYLLLTDA
jgi:hypothetical protein